MQSLSMEILHEVKKKATFWKVATIVCLAIAVAEFMLIAKGVF